MVSPRITPNNFNFISSQISDIYVAIEDRLFLSIVKRLKAPKEAGKDYVLGWQVDKLQQLNALNLETIELLAQESGLIREEVERIFEDVGFASIESIDQQLKRVGRKVLPPPSNINILLAGYVSQTFLDFDNLINETLISTNLGQGSVARTYRRIIEESVGQVIAGNITINQAVAESVIKASEKGFDSGFVDKGGRTWHVEQYAQTAIRTTVNNAYNEVRTNRMSDYGVDLVLVSSHSSARPACAPIQGGVCSLSNPSSDPDFPSIYEFGYGTPSGIRGINCSHILYPYIKGVSENNQRQVDEEKANKEYELTQKQRYLERQIRQSKRSLSLAQELGDDNTIQKYKNQLKVRQSKVREFVEETDLPRRYDRERVVL